MLSYHQSIINDGCRQNVYVDGTATGTMINAGGYQIDWGTATGTMINGGTQYVYGTATDTTIAAGLSTCSPEAWPSTPRSEPGRPPMSMAAVDGQRDLCRSLRHSRTRSIVWADRVDFRLAGQ
ncbi:hypothetical protein [Bradyrhizobium sp. A5]|uniref:hypothetical protein n=1 Tax=Bradyrhizobium sp. A5 TaxID=3133696 RepID=UPI0035C80A2C